jgi:hypothetical protein
VLSHFDFALSILKRHQSTYRRITSDDSTFIKKLQKCVYDRENIYDDLEQEKMILDHLD